MNYHPQQLQAWLARCRVNLAKFQKDRPKLSEEEQKQFVRDQFQILQTAVKVVKGKARFEGI
jgi:hypothetical protein